MPFVTWNDLPVYIRALLDKSDLVTDCGRRLVFLSSMLAAFRARFALDLNATALGHPNIRFVLSDPRLSDVCKLEYRDGARTVVQPARAKSRKCQ